MLEPVANIKTLLIEGSFSPVKAKVISTVNKFNGRHLDLVDPCNVAISKPISDLMASA